jgi:hypothetical protein
MEVTGQLHASATLLPGNLSPVLDEQRVGESQTGLGAMEKIKSLAPPLESNSDASVVQPVAYSLTWLL